MSHCRLLLSIAIAVLACATLRAADRETTVDYNRDVRPILAENCYRCHGIDEAQRKAGLRLDQKQTAFGTLRGGAHAIVPGDPGGSALVHRITSRDTGEVMPPPDSGKMLSAEQMETLRAWIEQGAPWEQHWAYTVPRRPPLPVVQREDWSRSAIDRFIFARLQKEGLAPSPEADRVTLLRRLSLDLLGLPPKSEDVDAFLADRSEDAYRKQVDRLLRSPHYGERMAVFWLDLVRFADTRGYHSDNGRSVAPYRAYVIRAFNENMPFDQFTIEQLAGDLLPNATIQQRVASCYNKLNQTTEEGGAQAKEYEVITAADRVRNVSAVWLGATLGCAQCHDHKFDPFQAKDFYSLAAFFADIQEPAIMDRDLGVAVPNREQRETLDDLARRIAAAKAIIDQPPSTVGVKIAEEQVDWEPKVAKERLPILGPWHAIGPFQAANPRAAFRTAFPPETEIDLAKTYQDGKLRWRREDAWVDGMVHALAGTNTATYLCRTIDSDTETTVMLSLGSDDGLQVWINEKAVLAKEVYRPAKPDQEKVSVPLRVGSNRLLMKIHNGGGPSGFYFKMLAGDGVPEPVRAVVRIPFADRTDDQRAEVAAFYRTVTPLLAETRRTRAALEKEKAKLEARLPRCLVCVSGKPREVRILARGDWMDRSGPVVTPAIPAIFGALDVAGDRASRLDLAQWIASPANPLTARVFVNRLWRMFFGTGLSKRLDDLGAMGKPPVHPKLLDWLAVEFVESGWDVQHLVREMLLSSTYRQSSVAGTEVDEIDPANRLLSHQSRWRIDAEFVRDSMLAISGLLSRQIAGPSVRPYQPTGYWVHLNFPKRTWKADRGENVYRRGLYTWWQRSFLHPSLMAFDAPNREECTVERPRSNIPQQALVLLNDPTYVESARVFAFRILDEGGDGTDERVRWAFREATLRKPDREETEILSDLHDLHRRSYADHPNAARELLGIGLSALPEDVDVVDLAAWTSVARAIFNLHETMTRN